MTQVRQIIRVARITRPAQRAFTLIEIIVVITIIAILASIALMVGNRVMQTGRINLTKDLLRILDKTQDSYLMDRDGKLPYKWTDTSVQKNEFGIVDGRITPSDDPNNLPNGDIVEPSTTFYLQAIGDSPSAQSTINGIDARFVFRAPISRVAVAPLGYDPTNFSTIYTKQLAMPQDPSGAAVSGLVIKDPWGNAIRYVHPKYQGGYGAFSINGQAPSLTAGRDSEFNFTPTSGNRLRQNVPANAQPNYDLKFRRSFRPVAGTIPGDADEGLCTGTRGYFYSSGPDKDAGSRGDNVYLEAKPQFPPENKQYE